MLLETDQLVFCVSLVTQNAAQPNPLWSINLKYIYNSLDPFINTNLISPLRSGEEEVYNTMFDSTMFSQSSKFPSLGQLSPSVIHTLILCVTWSIFLNEQLFILSLTHVLFVKIITTIWHWNCQQHNLYN